MLNQYTFNSAQLNTPGIGTNPVAKLVTYVMDIFALAARPTTYVLDIQNLIAKTLTYVWDQFN